MDRMIGEGRLDGGRWVVGFLLAGVLACSGPTATRDGGRPEPGAAPEGRQVERVYRVQIGLFDDKRAADRVVLEAQQWWRSVSPSEQPVPLRGVDDLPVDVYWKAPYYRVRIGPFVARDRAETVRDAAQSRFPDAFVAPEIVRRRAR